MGIHLNDTLVVEMEVPLLEIYEFYFVWRINCHGVMKISGLLNPNVFCQVEEFYDSRVNIKRANGGEAIFCGILTTMEITSVGNVRTVDLEVTTGSCRLDRTKGSRSFQDIESTYADTVRSLVETAGGRVICTAGKEVCLDRPVIKYQETEWEFVKRLASHLGTYIIADVEVGKPNFWFGIRKGKEILSLPAEDYRVYIRWDEDGSGEKQVIYEVQSREYHQLGDMARFWEQPVMVHEVRGTYRQGELLFTYLLSRQKNSKMIYQNRFTGMGLLGTVKEINGEKLKIALEIDRGISTGNYFYEWHPETGNGMYAMPEIGAGVFLTFGSVDEREGFVRDCRPMDIKDKLNYHDRFLTTKEEDAMRLNAAQVSISRKQNQKFSLSDTFVGLTASKGLRIRADGHIKIQAKDIYIKTLDVIKVHQG